MCGCAHTVLINQNRYILGEDLKDLMSMSFLIRFCGLWRDFSKVSGEIISEYTLRNKRPVVLWLKKICTCEQSLSFHSVSAITLKYNVRIHLFVRPSNS